MTCIFTDRLLLDQEYKRLFLEKLSSKAKLKECLSARYDKKEITDAELDGILLNNHKKIYDFIGKSNEHRVRYFFGSETHIDLRDSQVRLIDRVILDSIHFEVINRLILRFIDEYSNNQTDIHEEWDQEVQSHEERNSLPIMLIIQNAIKANKIRVFNDLVFPAKKTVALLQLKGQNITPNKHLFTNWLSPSKAPSRMNGFHLMYAGIALSISVLCAFFIYMISWNIAGSATSTFGASAVAALNPIGFASGLLVALILSGIISYACSNPKTWLINPSLTIQKPQSDLKSTEYIFSKLPKKEHIAESDIEPPTTNVRTLFAIDGTTNNQPLTTDNADLNGHSKGFNQNR
ncbi:hypothetical protein Lmor_0302 [Legionella moravica]|uniref:Uncharacterized protein n=1 Tax=Legionella moravica TaxID=39962 RepID=A0A378JW55_9GAMM|nr:hypothetical protein [Legionella moravica]KTD38481.1 hypothetical protein Lmor_0302 [Legionella moravica]STX62824.1 Uncharacterised protein [Legionella moravica]